MHYSKSNSARLAHSYRLFDHLKSGWRIDFIERFTYWAPNTARWRDKLPGRIDRTLWWRHRAAPLRKIISGDVWSSADSVAVSRPLPTN